MWWYSSEPVDEQRRPFGSTNAHWPLSRCQTARRTAAGMCRFRSSGGFPCRGRSVNAAFFASVRSSSSSSPFETITAGSRFGT